MDVEVTMKPDPSWAPLVFVAIDKEVVDDLVAKRPVILKGVNGDGKLVEVHLVTELSKRALTRWLKSQQPSLTPAE